jgi:ankyrin repeat protein
VSGGSLDCIKFVVEKAPAIDVNSADNGGVTPVMIVLEKGLLDIAKSLVEMGADLSMVDVGGKNALQLAASMGHCYCIDWLLDETTLGINSVANDGKNPIKLALENNHLDVAKHLVANGANLFLKANGNESDDDESDGKSALLDHPSGPRILNFAIELRWASVIPLFRLSTACTFPNEPQLVNCSFLESNDTILSRVHSARLVSSVFSITGLTLEIASYLLRVDIIVRDPSIPKKKPEEEEPDDVKTRIEAALAAAAGASSISRSNKRARKE